MDWHFTHVASQGAFAVIPEISLCDISYIIKKDPKDLTLLSLMF